MAHILTIQELEGAINRCKLAQPVSEGILPPDLRALATVYGRMIIEHLDSINVDAQGVVLRDALQRWCHPATHEGDAARVCALRGADSAGGECEACQ